MPEPSRQEIQKMQHEAEQRMREMQRKTARYSGNSDIPPVPNFVRVGQVNHSNRTAPLNHPQKPEENMPQMSQNNKALKSRPDRSSAPRPAVLNKGFDLLRMFNFNNFKIDSDITIIIVLILLLSSEETDELLLLALAYIML